MIDAAAHGAPDPAARIEALDLLRGVAVMGILLANIAGFALPAAAYLSPAAWGGDTGADLAAWAAVFILVEGKMRGLFSVLFGASMLLVIERARASGEDAAQVHFMRMATLFAIGLVHLYLIWWGDILTLYAMVGAVAWAFRRLPARWLVALGLALIGAEMLVSAELWNAARAAAPQATAVDARLWADLSAGFGVPPTADLLAEVAANRSLAGALRWRWDHTPGPLSALFVTGPETLGYMLLGMAGLRSGFLSGAWPRAAYRRWAVATIAVGWPAFALLAALTVRHGFDLRYVLFGSMVAAAPLRPVLVAGYAALVILLMRPGGRLTRRVAAAGRAAFTNYLGTSIVMTGIFYGLGLFGALSRTQLAMIVPLAWIVMLAWSKPWLDRFRFGPLEWLWRSLARLEVQPLRRADQ